MKKLLLLPALFLAGKIYAYDVRVVDGQIITNKWNMGGTPVFTDAEKAQILATAVDTGTGTIVNGDFVLETVPGVDQSIIADIQNDGGYSRSAVLTEIVRRKTKAYLLRTQAVLIRQQIDALNALSAGQGYDVVATTTALTTKLNTIKTLYNIASQ